MNVPEILLYTNDHEWAKIEDGFATIGITDYAQGELGDIVFVELPAIGDSVSQGDACGSIEAVKTVSDLFSPLSGEVTEVNDALETDPQLLNQDAYGEGWMVKLKLSDVAEADSLLKADAYKELIG